MAAAPHPIALVRKKANATGRQALLLEPIGSIAPLLMPYARRGARLLERLALERPALLLSSLLAELSAPKHKGVPKVLVDRLAAGLHALLDDAAPTPSEIAPPLRTLAARLADLSASLAHAPTRPRLARVTLELAPPAFFYTEGRGLDAVPPGLSLPLAQLQTQPLAWTPVRGAVVDDATLRYATERALDIVLDPILDEEERLISMLAHEPLVKLAHLGGGGLRITLPNPALAPALGLDDDDRDGASSWVVHHPARALDVIARLSARTDLVLAWASARKTRTHPLTLRDVRVRAGMGRDWLELAGGIDVDGDTAVSLAQLAAALREGRRYVVLGSDRIGVIADELGDALAPLSWRDDQKATPVALAHAQAAGVIVEAGIALDRLSSARAQVEQANGEPMPSFVGALRDYQRDGLRFLRRTLAWGSGAVLADEMGLGKTRTAIALLCDRASLGPQLVIAPTSVCTAWRRELAGCAPSLRVRETEAGARVAQVLDDAHAGDVVLASYGVVQRAASRFGACAFATLVLDEAQQVKNAAALRSRAVRALKADARIALTGTPLENHTGELWAVLSAVVPGAFGSWAHFKARFAQPIDKDHDVARRRTLARAIAPFVLRRKKAEVARELPPKLDAERIIEPSPAERRAYDDLRRALVLELSRPDPDAPPDEGARRVRILSALTRLRLCACHPALADDVELDPQQIAPGEKQRALVELLLELRENGERALVFSQFVRHLRIARAAAERAGLSTLELVGETSREQRSQRVDRFQAGEADAFFLSLKAGGFGLTLTRATCVVHLDPWWNPAAEDQATDRAHRIGQSAPVTVVRLVAAGTVEQAIVALHAQKRALVDAVLEGTARAGTCSTDELFSLLASTRRSARAEDEAQERVGAT